MSVTLSTVGDVSCQVHATGHIGGVAFGSEFSISREECAGFCESGVSGPETVYRVYRFVNEGDSHRAAQVKFDITIILPQRVGDELPRTRGHYHTLPLGRKRPYFDIYQVMVGNVVMQVHRKPADFTSVYLILAGEGDILCLPPDMCHVGYSLSQSVVALSNWCTRAPHLDYETMQATRGPAIRLSSFGPTQISCKWNPHFSKDQGPVVVLRPKPATEVAASMGIGDVLLHDWVYHDRFASLMSTEVNSDAWITGLYDIDAQTTKVANDELRS